MRAAGGDPAGRIRGQSNNGVTTGERHFMSDAFLNRFHLVWNRRRRVQIGQILAGAVLLGSAGLGLTAVADYKWELDNSARTVLVGATFVAVLGFAVTSLWR